PERTQIYEKIAAFLQLPPGELSTLAALERREGLKRKLAEPPRPLFPAVRDCLLRKCQPDQEGPIRAIFEKEPFGELERLVTQKVLEVVKDVVGEESTRESWIRRIARLTGGSFEPMRAITMEFLNTDVFSVAVAHCTVFAEPMIASWTCDLATFGLEIAFNQ